MHTRIEWVRCSMTALLCGGLVMSVGAGCKPKQEAPKPVAKVAAAPAVAVPAAAPAVPSLDPALVLADVGGSKLTVEEADKRIMAMLGPQAAQMPADRMASVLGSYRAKMVDRFVIQTLLSKEADRRSIKVEDRDIDEAIGIIKSRLPEGMTLEEALKHENMAMPDLRSNLVSELRMKKLVEAEVPTNMVPTEEEVTKFYETQKEQFAMPESVEARHILVKVDSADDAKVKAEKQAKAEGLRKQLLDGADFAKLAKENSDCPSKEQGGSLGSFPRGQMVKAFEDAAFSQETNAIGPVVETMFGYHIIQVTAHKQAGTRSLADVKDRLTEVIKRGKEKERFDAFLSKLKGDAKITYAEGFDPASMMPDQAE